jgi:hypothetical protein
LDADQTFCKKNMHVWQILSLLWQDRTKLQGIMHFVNEAERTGRAVLRSVVLDVAGHVEVVDLSQSSQCNSVKNLKPGTQKQTGMN